MFERFTDRARRVVVLAQEEARLRGYGEIDVGHVVLGALTVTGVDTGAAGHGDVVGVRRLIESSLDERVAKHSLDPAGHIPFTPAARDTLELGIRLALRAGRNYVAANDILLAALDQPIITEPLAAGGIDLDALRVAVRNALPEPTDQAACPEGLMQPSDSQVIIELLQQVLRRLDVIIERLDRDRGGDS